MNAELLHQVSALNPIPDDVAVPEGMLPAAAILQEIQERTTMTQTDDRTRVTAPASDRRIRGGWIAIATFAAVLIVGAIFALASFTGSPAPPATTPPPITPAPATTTRAPTTTTPAPVSPEARLESFFDAITQGDAATAASIAGSPDDAAWLVATEWVASSSGCQPEAPDSNDVFTCLVGTDAAVAERVGDGTLAFAFEYDEQTGEFANWQIAATQFGYEYRYYGSVYDGEAFAQACPDPDFMSGPGRTSECGSYLASIDALAAVPQPSLETLDTGVTRVNDVADGANLALAPGENRFDRTLRLFSLTVGEDDEISVLGSSLSATTLELGDGTALEIVSPLLYANPSTPLGDTEVNAPIPLPALGGFAPWIESAGFATIVDQGALELGAATAQFYDIEWTESGAIMRLAARPQGDMAVEAGTSHRLYVIDHPDGLPLVVFVMPGDGEPDASHALVEALLDGMTLRTSPVYP